MNYGTLVKDYGSPAYIYHLEQVRNAHAALSHALPKDSLLFYSLKANPHDRLVHCFYELGCGMEVSSIGEMHIAIAIGADPGKCLFTGPGKTDHEIIAALDCGVHFFSVESFTELNTIAKLAEKSSRSVRVLLRVNPDIAPNNTGLAMMGLSSQFGIDYTLLLKEADLLNRIPAHVSVEGFHFYMGSNIQSVNDILQCFRVSLDCATELIQQLGVVPSVINMGGGFGHQGVISAYIETLR